MKIVLCAVNAKYIHTNIAVRLIRGYCRNRIDSEISVSEFTINNHTEDIVQELYRQKPDILAFSCYIWNIEIIKKVSTIIKLMLPHIRIIFGGPEVLYNSCSILDSFASCDLIVAGEGENSSYQLFYALEKNLPFTDIPGIAYRNENGRSTVNPCAMPLDMAELPFPYDSREETENRICYYEASRGCPFRCSYCLSSIEKGVRFAPIEKVKKELRMFLDYGAKQVKFVDRTFNANNRFAAEIIKFIMENDNGYTNFHFEIAAEIFSDELTELIQKARKGLFQLEIGVQSTNEETLTAIQRTGAFDRISEVTRKIKGAGNTHVHLDLIAGLPFEDIGSFRKSFNDVHLLYPNQLQLGFLKVLHGSAMENSCDKHKIIYSPFPPYEVLYTRWLSADDILYLKKIEEMVETYYNSNRFTNSLTYLGKYSVDPFDMYDRLANNRSKVFTENISHNKNDTYRFLIDSAVSFEGADAELFRWIVKFDYIIHEKPKGTPDWTQPVLNLLNKDEIYELTVRKNIFEEKFSGFTELKGKEALNVTHIEKMPFNPVTYEKEDVMIFINYNERDIWKNAFYKIEKVNYSERQNKS